MCDPVTAVAIASAVATAAGNHIQQTNNNKSATAQVEARNKRAAMGVEEQQPNIQEGQSALNQAIQKLSGPAQAESQNKIEANRTAAINANATPVDGATNPMTNISNAPSVVQSDLAKKMSGAYDFSRQQAGALGAMGATGEQFQDNSNMLGINSTNLSNLSTKARQEAGVNRIQQESDYQNARKSPSIFGQLLSTAGTIGGMATGAAGMANLAQGAGQGIEGALRATSNLPPGPIPLTSGGIWSALTA